MPHIVRWLTVLGACALLSACFISDKPLIAPADADYPIADGARFAVWKLDPGGKRTGDVEHVTVTREGADYVYSLRDETPVKGLMDDIGNDTYIVLARDVTKPGKATYAAFRKDGSRWLRYAPNCSDFARLAATHRKSRADFHIEASGNDCAFSDYADLKAAMEMEVRYATPNGEYVAE
ncbi:MAG: hypothetical protein K8R18_02090 [Parvibaculum sp.]|uniref:hypothetical protein n=1 Tax=Parvibaculum sp. TaxID=2024848 RepID=UPI002600CDA0|nr:hypothetical protein [Parvibaculum sp.]MCE9648390.1 hypothetical protein [Parvibaculum sp.]